MGHDEAARVLEQPFVHYVGNQPPAVHRHFYGIREALPHFCGVALFDRLDGGPLEFSPLPCLIWTRREIENYLCSQATLEAYATASAPGPLFGQAEAAMREAIEEITSALDRLGRGSPWDADTKVNDDFLDPLFRAYF